MSVVQNDPAREAATEAQNLAADPQHSSWVSANAGSGKTKVLTDRVSRLLLHGVQPHRILCLTYTKAAAAQMQERLFERLGEWTLLEDEELRSALVALGEPADLVSSEVLREARRLFARALDTPGGLKIQTIHAFCGSVLRRFPLEAKVPPDFAEMDEGATALLLREVLDELAEGEAGAALIDKLIANASGAVEDIAENLIGLRGKLAPVLADPEFRADPQGWARYRLDALADPDAILADVLDDDAIAMLRELLAALEQSKRPTDNRLADKLSAVVRSENPIGEQEREDLARSFFTTKNKINSKVPTKVVWDAVSQGLIEWYDDFKKGLESWLEARHRRAAALRLAALLEFAAVLIESYEAAKRQRALLDFDDLVLKTRDLLRSSEAAVSWVMFKLDGGIDHILVDEAQDTSPEQWDIIEALAGEFFAGEGRDLPSSSSPLPQPGRSIFVVGDRKQSIYSFQGADPSVFDTMRGEMWKRLEAAGAPFKEAALEFSFRSAAPILHAVDALATLDGAREALEPEVRHRAFKADLPGCVDVWPRIEVEASNAPAPPESGDPHTAEETVERMIARRIVAFVRDNVGERPIHTRDGVRPMRHGDILILVRKRGDVFHEIIAALKRAGLPVAGVDRLKLTEELAVKDALALFRFLDLESDDLSLAEALRSPFLGLGERDLFTLAHGRRGTLWQALSAGAARPQAPARWQRAHAILEDLRAKADFLRPHDLLQRLLTVHGGRRLITGRLGAQGVEAVDALLEMAANFEGVEMPTLGRFLQWIEGEEAEIKRQLEGGSDEIRVMTVHGAKGLESPVVILPDAVRDRDDSGRNPPLLFPSPSTGSTKDGTNGLPLPLPDLPEAEAPPEVAAAKAEAKARRQEEDWRLLYVGMTRAEQWLVICGGGKPLSEKKAKEGPTDWHGRAWAALEKAKAAVHPFRWDEEEGEGLRLANPQWDEQAAASEIAVDTPAGSAHAVEEALPRWLEEKAPMPPAPPEPVNPSDLGGAKVVGASPTGGDDEAGALYGTWLHRLLEHLVDVPPERRAKLAEWLFEADPAPPEPAMREALLADLDRLLHDPQLKAEVFRPDALAEAALGGMTAHFGDRPFLGTIDRLLLDGDRVIAIDFKTNSEAPETPEEIPEGILRQMGAYKVALEEIWPDREVHVRILWTRTGALMDVPPSLAMVALQAGRLDPAEADT